MELECLLNAQIKARKISITEGQVGQSIQEDIQSSNETEGEVILRLTQSEPLVLFEFCSRFSQQEALSIEDQAEEIALTNLEAALEKVMLEPLLPDYFERVARARERLRDNG